MKSVLTIFQKCFAICTPWCLFYLCVCFPFLPHTCFLYWFHSFTVSRGVFAARLPLLCQCLLVSFVNRRCRLSFPTAVGDYYENRLIVSQNSSLFKITINCWISFPAVVGPFRFRQQLLFVLNVQKNQNWWTKWSWCCFPLVAQHVCTHRNE